jgi:hypothetical protein
VFRGDVLDPAHIAALQEGLKNRDYLGGVGDLAGRSAAGLAVNQEGLNLAAKARDGQGKSQSPLAVLG